MTKEQLIRRITDRATRVLEAEKKRQNPDDTWNWDYALIDFADALSEKDANDLDIGKWSTDTIWHTFKILLDVRRRAERLETKPDIPIHPIQSLEEMQREFNRSVRGDW
jgi:hypothetical protein